MENVEFRGKKTRRGNGNKKGIKKEIEYDIQFYEYEKNQNYYKQYKEYEYLSLKEKTEFENKFSKPKNNSQKKFLRSLESKDYKIVIANGPAGTGKTMLSIELGIKNFLLGNFDKLVFTRPVVSVDEDIGYLPGTLEEKMSPWVVPIFDIIHEFISVKEVKEMISEKIIEVIPLGMMRGRTLKNCWIVADEMQNSSISQMKMLLTRLGENSKLIITGDLEQNDRKNEVNGLEDFLNRFKGKKSNSISSIEFDKSDIEREEIVKEVLDIYETNLIPNYD
jgi:phosphate starvation-inducible PhoH-like protein